MDELKIKSSFMKSVISKVVTKLLYKKLGYKIVIQFEDIEVKITDEKAHIYVSADADIDVNEFRKIKKIIEEEV